MSKRPSIWVAVTAASFSLALVTAPMATASPAPLTAQKSVIQLLPSASSHLSFVPLASKPAPPRDPEKINVLVNKVYPLAPRKYTPKLRTIAGTDFRLHPEAAAAYKKLLAAARKDDVRIRLTSGYRSYSVQAGLLEKYTRAYGLDYALRIAARPGTSEHQTGLAIDVGNPSRACALRDCFATTKVGRWMAKNAPKYGFILRYPKGQESVTGYKYEPWHFRFVGVTQAKSMAGFKTLEHYYGVSKAPTNTPKTSKSAQGTKITTANLNLRTGPSTSKSIIKTVKKGSKVQLVGKTSGAWFKVKHGGKTGWMSSGYLR